MSFEDKVKDILSDKTISKLANDGTVVLGSEESSEDIEPLPTGFVSLDLSIGIGGLPRGKIIEISGEEGSFKSAILWAICGQVQRNDGVVAWIDAENAVDLRVPKFRKFLKRLRVDVDKILIVRPSTAEQAFKIVEALAESGNVDLIMFDSIVALSNQREEEADMEKTDRNTLAMSINKGLRKCAPKLRRNDCTLMVINQMRVNQDRKGPYDEKWQTTGGKGLKHWCSLRLRTWKRKIKDSNKKEIGAEIHVSVIKTRYDNARDEAVLYFYMDGGFDTVEEVMNLAVAYGVLDQQKQSYVWEGHDEYGKMSKPKWVELFNSNEEALEALTEEVIEAYNLYYDEEDEEFDYSSLTFKELVALCKERGIKAYKKDTEETLIEKLQEWDIENTSIEDESDEDDEDDEEDEDE